MSAQETKVEQDELTSRQKWILSVILGVLAIVCFSPLSFDFSSRVGNVVGIRTSKNGRPSPLGWALHVAFFILLIRFFMK